MEEENKFGVCDTVEVRFKGEIKSKAVKGLLIALDSFYEKNTDITHNAFVMWLPQFRCTAYYGHNNFIYHSKMVLIEKSIKDLDYFISDAQNIF